MCEQWSHGSIPSTGIYLMSTQHIKGPGLEVLENREDKTLSSSYTHLPQEETKDIFSNRFKKKKERNLVKEMEIKRSRSF